MGQKRTALHAGKRGTILVACSDATMARSCLTYLTAMFEDSAQLRTLQKRAAGDELHLHGNLWTGIATTTARLKPGAKRSR
jgi:hypothetical protein